MEVFSSYQAVQYDKENGFTTWLDLFKNKIPEVSKEVNALFDAINKGITNVNGISNKDLSDIFDLYKITESREDLEKFLNSWDGIGDVSESYQKWMIANGKSTSTFTSFTKKAGSVLKGFSASLLSMGIHMAIGEGIGTVITIIHDLATEMEQTEQRAKVFSGSLSGFNTEISDGQKKISELSEKYDELSKGVDNAGHVTTLPTEKYEEYKDVVQQLSELMPNLSTIFNEQGEAIGFTGGKIDDAKKKYQEYIQLQSQKLLSEGDEEGNTYQDVLNDYYNKTEKSENFWAALGGGMLQGAANVFTFGLLDANDFGYDTSNDLTIQGEIEQLERFIELTDQLDQTKVGQLSIDPIEETHVDYIEDILGQDLSDVAKLDTAKFNTFVQSVYTKIETLKQEQNAAFSKVQDGFVDMLTSDGAYWAIEDDAVKGNITSFVQSLSGDFFKEADVDLHNQNSVQTFIGQVVDSFAENRTTE